VSTKAWELYPSRSAIVVLTRMEAFELCEILAEAERTLVRSGRGSASSRVALAFELIEDRLFAARAPEAAAAMSGSGPW